MASSIGQVNQLAAAIALQLSRSAEPQRAGPARAKKAEAARRGAERDLSALIGLRVREIDPADPQRGKRAFRVFLEAVLLQKFGERLINDPGFHQLVDEIQGALDTDPKTHAMVKSAAEQLIKQSLKR
jgi:hypothetical protein